MTRKTREEIDALFEQASAKDPRHHIERSRRKNSGRPYDGEELVRLSSAHVDSDVAGLIEAVRWGYGSPRRRKQT